MSEELRSKPLTSREVADRLHEQTMAALTRTTPQTPPKTPTIAQYGTSAHAGQWYCKDLGGNPYNTDLDAMTAWSRELDLARQVQKDLMQLNADQISDALQATLDNKRAERQTLPNEK